MSGIMECTLPADYRTDVLFGLSAERLGELIKVVFDSAIDPSYTWHVLCAEARIAEVAQCRPDGNRAHLNVTAESNSLGLGIVTLPRAPV